MNTAMQREDLRKLMMKRAPDSSMTHPGRGILSRYLDIAHNGEWTFKDAASLDAAALTKHVSNLFGIFVNDICFVSLSDPYGDLGWMTEDEFRRLDANDFATSLENCLDPDIDGTFWGRLDATLGTRQIRGLGDPRLEIIDDDVARTFVGLRSALYVSVLDELGLLLAERAWHGIEDALARFMACVALDDRQGGVPLGNMVRELAFTLPLGMKRDDPGSWIFLSK